jgi:hypothetical protein
MRFFFIVILCLPLLGCQKEATPEAAVHSAMTSKEKANALQSETAQRNAEGERIADGK